jgi:hypothetical protein
MKILYGNVCINPMVISLNDSVSCTQLQNGILTAGIASALNFIS